MMTMILSGQVILLWMVLDLWKVVFILAKVTHIQEKIALWSLEIPPGLSISVTALVCDTGHHDIITTDVNIYIILGNEERNE